VPVHHDVDAVECAGADHPQLAEELFLRRRAVKTDGTVDVAGLDQLLDRDRGTERGRAEDIVTATVTGCARFDR